MNKNDIRMQNLDTRFTVMKSESKTILQATFNFYLLCKITRR